MLTKIKLKVSLISSIDPYYKHLQYQTFNLKWEAYMEEMISVVIVTFKRPHLLHKLILMLDNQDLPPKTVIVVDNDPKLSAKESVDSAIPRKSKLNVKYVSNHINSLPVGRNIGVNLVETEFTCLLDDDVRIQSDYLKIAQETMLKHSEAVGLQGLIKFEKRSYFKNFVARAIGQFHLTKDSCRVLKSISTSYPGFYTGSDPLACEWLSGSNQVYRTSCLLKIKWDENLLAYGDGEDLDHSYRVHKSMIGKLYLVPQMVVMHDASEVGRAIGYKNILMREGYSYYLRHKLFRNKSDFGVIYFLSRLCLILVAIIKFMMSGFRRVELQNLIYLFRALLRVLAHRNDLRLGKLIDFNHELNT